MDRSNTISKISVLCRRDHGAALWALAWLALDLPTADLERLLEHLEEFQRVHTSGAHLDAYAERWGRRPDTSL
jgi:hypothetical protein